MFSEEEFCRGKFHFSNRDIKYRTWYDVKWFVNSTEQSVLFIITTKYQPTHGWIAIGFSKTGAMVGSDIILYNPVSNRVKDMFSNNQRELKEDKEQNLIRANFTKTKHTSVVMFERPLTTSDVVEDVSLDQCIKFLYPVHPGVVCQTGETIGPHFKTPITSKLICMNKCSKPPAEALRVINCQWTFRPTFVFVYVLFIYLLLNKCFYYEM